MADSGVLARCNDTTLCLFLHFSSFYSFLQLISVSLGSEGQVYMQGSLHSQHVIEATGRHLLRPCWLPGTAAVARAEEKLGAHSWGQLEEQTHVSIR